LCRLRWSPQGGLARNPSLLRALLAKATAQSGETCAPWAGLAAVERVRAFLADFRRRANKPLPMTRAQIGQHLGLAEETVVHAMKALRAG
jgi:CRP-like cAMP-binding protein